MATKALFESPFLCLIYCSLRFPRASFISDCPHIFQRHQKPSCSRIHQGLSSQGEWIVLVRKLIMFPFLDNNRMGPSIALGWEKVLPWPGQPHCKKIQLHLVVQVIWRSRKKTIFIFSDDSLPWIPDRRIDSNPPEAWNMSKIEMEELDTNEDGIMEKFPIYVQNKAQRIPRPRDPQLVDPQPGCFGNGPGPMKVLLVL